MPASHRHKDICTGHSCFPPRPNSGASGNVYVNGKGVHRVGDGWQLHKCGKNKHGGVLASCIVF